MNKKKFVASAILAAMVLAGCQDKSAPTVIFTPKTANEQMVGWTYEARKAKPGCIVSVWIKSKTGSKKWIPISTDVYRRTERTPDATIYPANKGAQIRATPNCGGSLTRSDQPR